jgi:hypothetical protein
MANILRLCIPWYIDLRDEYIKNYLPGLTTCAALLVSVLSTVTTTHGNGTLQGIQECR